MRDRKLVFLSLRGDRQCSPQELEMAERDAVTFRDDVGAALQIE